MNLADRGEGHLRIGRLLFSWPVRQGFGTPVIDGCWVSFVRAEDDGTVIEIVRHGGVALRPWWREHALAIAWRGAKVPNLRRLRWRYLKHHRPLFYMRPWDRWMDKKVLGADMQGSAPLLEVRDELAFGFDPTEVDLYANRWEMAKQEAIELLRSLDG